MRTTLYASGQDNAICELCEEKPVTVIFEIKEEGAYCICKNCVAELQHFARANSKRWRIVSMLDMFEQVELTLFTQ